MHRFLILRKTAFLFIILAWQICLNHTLFAQTESVSKGKPISGKESSNPSFLKEISIEADTVVLMEKINEMSKTSSYYKKLISNYSLNGNYLSALDYQEKLINNQDSIAILEKIVALTNLQLQFEAEQSKNEISLMNARNDAQMAFMKRQKIQSYGFLAGGIFLFLLVVGLFSRLRFLRKAKKIVNRNLTLLSGKITANSPLVGIEPSAILSFRDEYPELAESHLQAEAEKIAKNAFTIEEFLYQAMKQGKISSEMFKPTQQEVLYHGHCQQKSIASTKEALAILSLPKGWNVKEIPSGCCGMAGSFGYEKEHYDVSMKVGELVLFPAVRKSSKTTFLAASGTSCRHQIKDGTGRKAQHPVELLYDALL